MTDQHASPSPAGPTQSRPGEAFFDSIRGGGLVRTEERWVGGVAGGIARRLGVDPLLVRGVMVVLTFFGGLGLLLYGLGWALLPEESDGRIHAQEAVAGRFDVGFAGALLMVVIGAFRPGVWWRGFWWGDLWATFGVLTAVAVIVLVAYWVIPQARAGRGDTTEDPSAPAPATSQPPTAAHPQAVAPTPAEPHTPADTGTRPTPSSTDPRLLAGPLAFTTPLRDSGAATETLPEDQPDTSSRSDEHPSGTQDADARTPSIASNAVSTSPTISFPAPPAASSPNPADAASVPTPRATATRTPTRVPPSRHPTQGPGPAMGRIVLALALLGAAGSLILSKVLGWDGSMWLLSGGVALTVLGAGIVIAGARGRHSGWLGFWSVVASVMVVPLALVLSAAPQVSEAISLDPRDIGSTSWRPASAEELLDGASLSAGRITADLRDIPLGTALDEQVHITLATGQVILLVPEGLDVEIEVQGTGALRLIGMAEPWYRDGRAVTAPHEQGMVGSDTIVRPTAARSPADIDIAVAIGAGDVMIREVRPIPDTQTDEDED